MESSFTPPFLILRLSEATYLSGLVIDACLFLAPASLGSGIR